MHWSRMAASTLATTLAVSSLMVEASAQGGAVRSNVSDSAQVILQRYAEAWRGRQELEFRGTLVLAFWVRGEQGGEYTVALSDAPGSVAREGTPRQYDIGFELDMDFLRRLDRGRSARSPQWDRPEVPIQSP